MTASARILLMTYISPLQRWGSAQRSRLLVNALKQYGQVEVLVLSFSATASESMVVLSDLPDGVKIIDVQIPNKGIRGRARFDWKSDYVSSLVAKYVTLADFDLLVSRYVRPALKLDLPLHVPLIVDFDDALYDPPWQALRTPKHWVGALLRLFNDRCITRARLRHPMWSDAHFWFCAQAERRAFGHLQGKVLPNLPPPGPAVTSLSFAPPQHPAILFIGLLDYMPNHDAVDWFLSEIWPIVLRSVPEAQFLIVGEGEAQRLAKWAAHTQVQTLGFVESLADAYARASCCVVPMRSGAGTNIKALEPYLYGRMVVATSMVVEGHEPLFRTGQDILEANDAQGLAKHCIDILRNPTRAAQIAQSGLEQIRHQLSVERFEHIVQESVQALLPDLVQQNKAEKASARALDLALATAFNEGSV